MLKINIQTGLDWSSNPIDKYVTATFKGRTVQLIMPQVSWWQDCDSTSKFFSSSSGIRDFLVENIDVNQVDGVIADLFSYFSESACSCCGGGLGDGFSFYPSGCVQSQSCDI